LWQKVLIGAIFIQCGPVSGRDDALEFHKVLRASGCESIERRAHFDLPAANLSDGCLLKTIFGCISWILVALYIPRNGSIVGELQRDQIKVVM
jgi:hypothetical protein